MHNGIVSKCHCDKGVSAALGSSSHLAGDAFGGLLLMRDPSLKKCPEAGIRDDGKVAAPVADAAPLTVSSLHSAVTQCNLSAASNRASVRHLEPDVHRVVCKACKSLDLLGRALRITLPVDVLDELQPLWNVTGALHHVIVGERWDTEQALLPTPRMHVGRFLLLRAWD